MANISKYVIYWFRLLGIVSVWILGIYLGYLFFNNAPRTHFLKSETKILPSAFSFYTFPFAKIFWNNFKVGFSILIGSFLTCGLLGLFIIGANGVSYGVLLASLLKNGKSSFDIFQGFVYHGVIEVLALCIFCEIGFVSIFLVKHYIKEAGSSQRYIINFSDIIKKVTVATILLVIAALIESYLFLHPNLIGITPK